MSVIALVAAGLSVLLLLVFVRRLQKQLWMLEGELERASFNTETGRFHDRRRFDEATEALEAVKADVAEQQQAIEGLKGLAPRLDTFGGRVDGVEGTLSALESAVSTVEQRMADGTSRLEQAEDVARGVVERGAEDRELIADTRARLTDVEVVLRDLHDLRGEPEELDPRLDATEEPLLDEQDEATVEDVPRETTPESWPAEDVAAENAPEEAAETEELMTETVAAEHVSVEEVAAEDAAASTVAPEEATAEAVATEPEAAEPAPLEIADEGGPSEEAPAPAPAPHEESVPPDPHDPVLSGSLLSTPWAPALAHADLGGRRWVMILAIGLAGVTVLLLLLGIGG